MRKSVIYASMLAAAVLLGGISQSAVCAAEQQVSETAVSAPIILSAPAREKGRDISEACAKLPHTAAAVIQFTVKADGTVSQASVRSGTGYAVLDTYALRSVQDWTFTPASSGGHPMDAMVRVPFRFQSMKQEKPPVPKSAPMAAVTIPVKMALADYPDGTDVKVSVYVTAEGDPQEITADPAADAVLGAYASECVAQWKFTPAMNPDGEAIPSEKTEVTVHINGIGNPGTSA